MDINTETWWTKLLAKMIENAPTVAILIVIAYFQQAQINRLFEICILP